MIQQESFNPTTSESDFRKFREINALYVDKTLFIRDILSNTETSMVILRPRRFGKTLNLSMLEYFFSNKETEINRSLFEGLAITDNPEAMAHFGQYPTIFLSLKDIKAPNATEFFESMQIKMRDLYQTFNLLSFNDLYSQSELDEIKSILNKTSSAIILKYSLKQLSVYLQRMYNKPVVILLDEYDTPINESYLAQEPYYRECADFMRTFIGAAFKGNTSLHKAVITGILQVGKESIFSDANNLQVYTMLDDNYYSSYFGLTTEEIEALVDRQNALSMTEIRDWYNGYQIGEYRLYNPFSVIKAFHNRRCAPYWMNSSSNNLIREVITKGSEEVKEDLACLLQEGIIRKRVNTKTVFSDIHHPNVLWGLFVATGYLSPSNLEIDENDDTWCQLRVPNREVRQMYRQMIEAWFTDKEPKYYTAFLDSIVEENPILLEKVINRYLLESASYFDLNTNTPEKVYAAFMLGIVAGLKNKYTISSNTEVGWGRCDVMMSPKDKTKTGFIIEFKTCEDGDFAQSQQAAFVQIENKKYTAKLEAEGINTIRKWAISFYKQMAKVEMI